MLFHTALDTRINVISLLSFVNRFNTFKSKHSLDFFTTYVAKFNHFTSRTGVSSPLHTREYTYWYS